MFSHSNLIGGIIFITMGILFIIFHKFIGNKSADFINKQPKYLRWGLQSGAFVNRISFLAVGVLFIIFGFKLLI